MTGPAIWLRDPLSPVADGMWCGGGTVLGVLQMD